jgi:hypothetical protein
VTREMLEDSEWLDKKAGENINQSEYIKKK